MARKKGNFLSGFASTALPLMQDAALLALKKKIERKLLTQKSLSDQELEAIQHRNKLAEIEAGGEKQITVAQTVAAEQRKETERKEKEQFDAAKNAFLTDIESDASLTPEFRARIQSVVKADTPQALERGQKLYEQHYELKGKEREHGWELEKVRLGKETEKAKQLTPANKLIEKAQKYIQLRDESVMTLTQTLVEKQGMSLADARALAQKAVGHDPDDRKNIIAYMQTYGRIEDPELADSIIAANTLPQDMREDLDKWPQTASDSGATETFFKEPLEEPPSPAAAGVSAPKTLAAPIPVVPGAPPVPVVDEELERERKRNAELKARLQRQ